jgi:hypothetical protein
MYTRNMHALLFLFFIYKKTFNFKIRIWYVQRKFLFLKIKMITFLIDSSQFKSTHQTRDSGYKRDWLINIVFLIFFNYMIIKTYAIKIAAR